MKDIPDTETILLADFLNAPKGLRQFGTGITPSRT
jgi:hypothetical protein